MIEMLIVVGVRAAFYVAHTLRIVLDLSSERPLTLNTDLAAWNAIQVLCLL